jgi:hypothetical protein
MSIDHIKIPDTKPVIRYLADGAATVFTYPFPIFASEDINITIDGAPQEYGFTISGAGQTTGGTVAFDTAPASGVIIVIERSLSLERLTDFLEGGEFSAQSINTELDYLLASIQQVNSKQSAMIRVSNEEDVENIILPAKALRADKVLGFDSDGLPVAVDADGTMTMADFTTFGSGAITRTATSKMSDVASVRDFGAAGDGLTDDTLAFQKALAANDHVFVPSGTYLISSTIILSDSQSLVGAGQSSILTAQSDSFSVIEMIESRTHLSDIKIVGGLYGLSVYGKDASALQNIITRVVFSGSKTAIYLDGYSDTAKPCEGNSFIDILIEEPVDYGVHLDRSGGGHSPRGNRFINVRVVSDSQDISECGFYVEYGDRNNSFINCEADLSATATACFRVGTNSRNTVVMNLLTVAPSGSVVTNIQLDDGSLSTSVFNHTSLSDGAAIYDLSGGEFDSYNAGYPNRNRFQRITVTDLTAGLMRYETEYINTAGTTSLDLSHSVHIVDATNGAMTLELPLAADAEGAQLLIKKKDVTANIVTIDEVSGGPGPDGTPLQLGGENDYAVLISNGAEWFIVSSNRIRGNTRYIDSTGTIDIDMSVDTYILSSYSGVMTARLPPANADEAWGRTITLKKTDVSSNNITITEQGGSGPDQSSHVLSSQYDAITVVSDGGQWYVVSKYS